MIVFVELRTDDGKIVGTLMVKQKEFKTGSRGFYGNAKIEISGRRYQTQIQLVEIGSKSSKPETIQPEAQKKGRRAVKAGQR